MRKHQESTVCRSAHVFPLINPYNVVMVMHGMHTHCNGFYLERRKINTKYSFLHCWNVCRSETKLFTEI